MEWTILNNISIGNKLTTYFTTNWSHDGRIFIITDASVSIFKFDYNFTNHENTLHFIKTEVNVSDYHVADETNIDIDDYMLMGKKETIYNSILNHNLTPNTKHANSVTARAINATWSPIPNSNKNYNALLFILSNTGNVEIYEQNRKIWKLLANISQFWVQHLQKISWNKEENSTNSETDPDKISAIHSQRVEHSLATCFALSKIYYDDKNIPFFFIVVGYGVEYITIWKYYFSNNKTKPIFVNSITTKLKNLTTICICSLNDTDWIVIGNIDGIVKAIPVINLSTNSFKSIKNIVDIWTHQDVRVSKIINFQINSFLCLLIIKGPFIILSVLNDSQEIVCVKHINVKNLNVTGIVPHKTNSYAISTLTGAIYLLEINQNNEEFSLNLSPIKTDLKWDYHACYGLIKSPGDLLWGIVAYPCKMTDHLVIRNAIQISFLINHDFDPTEYLKNQIISKSDYITESIDILRCYCSKNNIFPSIWLMKYDKYDELSVRQVQVLMWISEFCQAFVTKKSKFKKLKNPFVPPNILKELLLFKYRLERINKLLSDMQLTFSTVQENSLYLLYDALIKFRNGENFKLYFGEKMIKEMELLSEKIKKFNLNTNLKCVWCDDQLTSESCPSNHPDQRCCITGVQISGIAKIECEKCTVPADEHIKEEQIICPFCDVLMTDTT